MCAHHATPLVAPPSENAPATIWNANQMPSTIIAGMAMIWKKKKIGTSVSTFARG